MIDTLNEIIKQIEEAKSKAKLMLCQEAKKFLEADGNQIYKTVYFGGYTPYFNDGDECTFTSGPVLASNLDSGDIYHFECNDSEYEIEPEELNEIYTKLLEIGIIEDLFESRGFIAKIYKNDVGEYVLVEEEYDCGY